MLAESERRTQVDQRDVQDKIIREDFIEKMIINNNNNYYYYYYYYY